MKNQLERFLAENQFVLSGDESISRAAFGNSMQVYSDGLIDIRIILDRGRGYIDLRKGGQWKDVFTLAAQVDPEFKVNKGSFTEAVGTLIQYWPQIKQHVQTLLSIESIESMGSDPHGTRLSNR